LEVKAKDIGSSFSILVSCDKVMSFAKVNPNSEAGRGKDET
jgi:hypothetical protein